MADTQSEMRLAASPPLVLGGAISEATARARRCRTSERNGDRQWTTGTDATGQRHPLLEPLTELRTSKGSAMR